VTGSVIVHSLFDKIGQYSLSVPIQAGSYCRIIDVDRIPPSFNVYRDEDWIRDEEMTFTT
jgi:hypothetical protein